MSISVRAFAAEDADRVVALALDAWRPVFASLADVVGDRLFRQFFGPDWRAYQEQDVRRACSTYRTWVAEADGVVVGFTAVEVPEEGDEGEIYMLAVDPAHQRRGIGSALTAFAVERIREAGKAVAVVATGGDPGHAAARATYEKAGFTALPSIRYYRPL